MTIRGIDATRVQRGAPSIARQVPKIVWQAPCHHPSEPSNAWRSSFRSQGSTASTATPTRPSTAIESNSAPAAPSPAPPSAWGCSAANRATKARTPDLPRIRSETPSVPARPARTPAIIPAPPRPAPRCRTWETPACARRPRPPPEPDAAPRRVATPSVGRTFSMRREPARIHAARATSRRHRVEFVAPRRTRPRPAGGAFYVTTKDAPARPLRR